MKKIKSISKQAINSIFDILFRYRNKLSFLKLYPRARNYIYDIINFYTNNNLTFIFDIGANIGQSALYFQKFFPKAAIHSIEPINKTYNTLVQNTKAHKNIINHNFAFGDLNQNIKVSYITNSGENSLIKEVNESIKSENKQLVNITTVDDFIAKYKIEHIDLMKIDTEGFDYKVLKGAEKALKEKKIDFIVCEVGFLYDKRHGNFEEINDFLYKNDYWLSGFYDNYYWGTRYILHGFTNAMYIRKELAFR